MKGESLCVSLSLNTCCCSYIIALAEQPFIQWWNSNHCSFLFLLSVLFSSFLYLSLLLFLFIPLRARDQLADVIKAATKWVSGLSSLHFRFTGRSVTDSVMLQYKVQSEMRAQVFWVSKLTIGCTVCSLGTVLLFRETPSCLWVAWLLSLLNMRATCLLIATAASG